jgi:hypothetical protein
VLPAANECSPGCAAVLLGDGVCHAACNTVACNFDWADCTSETAHDQCSPGCILTMLADGRCDPGCANNRCSYDYGDCEPPTVVYDVSGGSGSGASFILYAPQPGPLQTCHMSNHRRRASVRR